MSEKVIQKKICKSCSWDYEITSWDKDFFEKISPIFNWKKYMIPYWEFCPKCKEQRKMSFRNERNLYKRKCSATGEDIISVFSPDKTYPVYSIDMWWSDKWDWIDYALEPDFSKCFFSQFSALYNRVPKLSIFQKNCENSPYSHLESDQKDCYMTMGWHFSENSAYMWFWVRSKKCFDVFWWFDLDNCYEVLNSYRCNKCKYLEYSDDCFDCTFWYNLKWCQSSIWCVWLTNKKYCILNKEYSKEEYEEELKKLNLSNYSNMLEFKNRFKKLILESPHRHANLTNTENSSWTDIFNSKNINNWFLIEDSEDLKNVSIIGWWKTARDVYAGWLFDRVYEVMGTWISTQVIAFSILCYEIQNSYYCMDCHNSSNLFLCTWLKNKSYCILNKQYTKQEYEELVPKIIEKMREDGEWWEFFPSSMSPFGYNETVANEYIPLKKDEAIKAWFNWSDYEAPKPNVEKIIPASKLPENIEDIPDDILNRAIECEVTKKPFRIIKQELEFYRKHNLPIPRRHPDQRHLDRMALRNPRKLYDRKCDKCSKDIKTTYSLDRPEIVYCEECYNNEVY